MNKISNIFFKSSFLIAVCCLAFIATSKAQTQITPIRTDVSGFGTWTDVSITGTTYLQMYTPAAASKTTTPTMDFTPYSSITLDFKARTFGGVNAAKNTITVSISTDGSSWTSIGTRVPGSSTLTAVTQFDLSAYNVNSTVRLKFETLASDGSVGAGIDEIDIKGIVSCTAPADPTGSITPAANPACTNTTLTYSAAAANFYWQTSATGTSTANPTTTALTVSSSGTYYVRNYNGTCWSTNSLASAAITVNTAISITAQPPNRSITNGSNTTFTVTATGTSPTYQWEVNTGSGWTTLTNSAPYSTVTTSTLNITAATLSMSTYQYRCVVSGASPCAAATSNAGTLTVTNVSPNNGTSLAGNCKYNTSIDLTWTASSGGTAPDGYIVFAIAGASAPASASPNDAGTYTANSDFSAAATVSPAALGKCVYKGTGTSVTLTGFTNGSTYSFVVVAYIGSSQTGYATGINAAGSWRLTSQVIDMPEATSAAASQANTSSVVTWTKPTSTCFDEMLVIASTTSVTFTPSGDGTAYTANAVYGSGTNVGGAQYVVYKATSGSSASVTVTGLTNGTNYCYKIFLRNGTEWSNGTGTAEDCEIPGITIPENDCGGSSAISTFTYSGGSTISDVNITVFITHTYRADLKIEVESPNGTIVQLIDGNDGGAGDNLEATFDDEAAGFVTSNNHTSDLSIDETVKSGTTDLLSLFDGESPNGTWTIRICDDAIADVGSLLSWSVGITNTCVPTHTVTSFAPASGPEKTMVTITGTGFTASTTVSFGGVASTSVTFVSSTTIIAEVPTGAVSGNIVVTESSCGIAASGTYTVTLNVGTCSAGVVTTGLIISEVYDQEAGCVGYIELYNGTASTIDLTTYSIKRATSLNGATSFSYTFPTSGVGSSIAPGEVLVGGICTGSSSIYDFQFVGGSTGFNEGDQLDLYNGATHIDRFYESAACGAPGYSYIRKTTATPLPSTTYAAGDWTTSCTESTAGLGDFGTVNPPPSVTAEPADVTSCSMTYSVTATAGSGGALTYQWYYNDGSSSSWTAVSAGPFAPSTVAGATTNSLTISGTDVGNWNGYQFYCQVTEDGSCGIVSDAAQFLAQSDRYFRSKVTSGSGTWTSTSYWEMATSAAGPWSDACTYPTYSNSDYIHILNGDIMNITSNLTLDQVVIEAGGTISTDATSVITINNGTGDDWEVQGTYIENSSSGNGLSFNASSTWILGSSGTIVKTNNSSVIKFKDYYSGGISTIPSTGYWIYRYTSNPIVAVNAVGMFYPNLTFESTSGLHDWSGATEMFTGSAGFCTVKGNMDVGGSGAGTVKTYNINTNASQMLIIGNLTVQSGSTLTNYDGAATYGTGFELQGNLTVAGTLVTETTGNFKFSGGSTQTVSGAGTITIYNGTVNKSANHVTLSRDLEFKSTLTLTAGNIQTNANKVVLSNTVAANLIHTTGNASFINGNLRRYLASNTSIYEFPLGDGNTTANYKRLDLINNNLTGTGYLDTYVAAISNSGNNVDSRIVTTQNGSTMSDVLEAAEWNLVPDIQPTGGTYGVMLYTANTGLTAGDDNTFCAVKRADASADYADWNSYYTTTTIPASGSAGRIYNSGNGYAQRTGYTSFSKHAHAKTGSPLPIKLLSFDAIKKDKVAVLDWATAQEQNSNCFEIERSRDAKGFIPILKTNAAGYSNGILNYQLIDERPLKGNNYYRLKETDFDGKFEYSEVRKLNFEETSKGLELYQSGTNLIIKLEKSTEVEEISLFDVSGRLVESYPLHLNEAGTYEQALNSLSSGIYLISAKTNNGIISQRIIVK